METIVPWSLVDKPERHATYNTSSKGRERYARRNDKRAERSVQRYLDKEFLAWDGEGGNETDGSHTYFLLANSDGQSLSVRGGLSTTQVFDMLLASRNGVTNIGFGLGYDINMWCRDIDRDTMEILYRRGFARWQGYYLEWKASKSFTVRRKGRSVLIYDVLPFFQKSFVSACDEYLQTDGHWQAIRERVIADKARRGSFDWTELEEIKEYNGHELSTLVRLADELKARLFAVEIRVARWDGPGAIASALYKKYGTKSHISKAPEMVAKAGRHAYAGGRFEIIRKGHSTRRAYQYDLRSAYPSAMRSLPCLAHGRWVHRDNPTAISAFGMYRIEVNDEPATDSETQPQPLWMRNKNGTVYFSEYSHGWYWSPEAQLASEMGGITIHESWEFICECDHEPFWFVEPLYNKRAALKKARDGAHVGLKLGLNSLYGKLAQQVGWDPGPPLKLPPYHCLEWAGYITSHCRAEVYRAALTAPDDIIAFETDAVFSRTKLNLDIGERLGQWDETIYKSLTYLKSGMYFGTQIGKDGALIEVEKCRGINKGTLTRMQVIDALAIERSDTRNKRLECGQNFCKSDSLHLHAEQTRFVGIGAALNTDYAKWRRWFTDPREISISLNGKRIDLIDKMNVRKHIHDGWYETQEGLGGIDTEFSHPYEVEWIALTDIADLEGNNLREVRRATAHDTYEWELE